MTFYKPFSAPAQATAHTSSHRHDAATLASGRGSSLERLTSPQRVTALTARAARAPRFRENRFLTRWVAQLTKTGCAREVVVEPSWQQRLALALLLLFDQVSFYSYSAVCGHGTARHSDIYYGSHIRHPRADPRSDRPRDRAPTPCIHAA